MNDNESSRYVQNFHQKIDTVFQKVIKMLITFDTMHCHQLKHFVFVPSTHKFNTFSFLVHFSHTMTINSLV